MTDNFFLLFQFKVSDVFIDNDDYHSSDDSLTKQLEFEYIC